MPRNDFSTEGNEAKKGIKNCDRTEPEQFQGAVFMSVVRLARRAAGRE